MTDAQGMARALALARRAVGSTAPNPPVGAVVVLGAQVLGEGHTQPAGGRHAEVVALQQANKNRANLTGATLYVTLEPCSHHGKNGPCTQAIAQAGVGRVVVGVRDPNPKVDGMAALQAAGIRVTQGVAQAECSQLLRGFLRAMRVGLPEVTAKVATSLDGHLAAASGKSQWITGPAARERGHALRASHDAMLVGIGTVLADNPRLSCRIPGGSNPVPVVLDTHLRLPDQAALLLAGAPAVVCCAHQAPHRPGLRAQVVRVASGPNGLDLVAVLKALAARGLYRILVEGGAAVHRSLFDAQLVDTLAVFIGDVVVPGGQPWMGGAPVADVQGARRLGPPQVEPLGSDVLLTYALAHRTPCQASHQG